MDESIKTGRIAFASRIKPILAEGDYHLKIESDVELPQSAKEEAKIAVLHFTVDYERVALSPDLVYSTYPPRNFSGRYGQCLPHIILQRRTLPWEKTLGLPGDPPYLALLVFSDGEGAVLSELEYKQGDPRPGPIPPRTFVPEPYKKIPDEIPSGSERAQVVDIPAELFCDVLPTAPDLPYLSHMRNVSLDDKVTDSAVTDGWFSCVTANRLPLEPTEGESVAHTAHLVSLEGFEALLKGDGKSRRSILEGFDSVRMFSLYSWNFFCERRDVDFERYAALLKADVLRPDTGGIRDDRLREVVGRGYVPVNHLMREGSRAVSWYHSPLLPHKPTVDNIPFGTFADALLRYDKELDMLDVTYSAAWQLGRLLALQNQPFAADLVRWREGNKGEAVAEQNRNSLFRACEDTQPSRRFTAGPAAPVGAAGGIPWGAFLSDLESACGMSDPVNMEGTGLTEYDLMKGGTAPARFLNLLADQDGGTFESDGGISDREPTDQAGLLRYFQKNWEERGLRDDDELDAPTGEY